MTPTAGRVVFFGDIGGNFYALDAVASQYNSASVFNRLRALSASPRALYRPDNRCGCVLADSHHDFPQNLHPPSQHTAAVKPCGAPLPARLPGRLAYALAGNHDPRLCRRTEDVDARHNNRNMV